MTIKDKALCTPTHSFRLVCLGVLTVAALAWPVGCAGPMKERSEAELKAALDRAMKAEIKDQPRREIALEAPRSRLREENLIDERFIPELEEMAGPTANRAEAPIEFGTDLNGEGIKTVQINLQEAVHTAVENNLAIQIGTLTPAMREADVTRAEARFDAVLFTNFEYSKIDAPTTVPFVGGTPLSTGVFQQDTRQLTTGIRKNLITGGIMSLSTGYTRTGDESPGRRVFPSPAYESTVELTLSQPLLQGAGSEANLSEIRLNRNAHRREIETYRATLLEVAHRTEEAYWRLVAARQAVLIRERLLDRGSETQRTLRERGGYDATSAEISDADSRVQNREVDVLRAKDSVLRASDQLKALMNAPGLPVGSEIIIIPTDDPLVDPLSFTYVDIVLTGLQNRPELRQALLAIDDASIRQMLAENLRLPTLDFNATVRWNGLDNTFSEAYEHIGEQEYIDYILGLTFEHPIGNREAQANYRIARLTRIQSVLRYRQAVQEATLALKDALRALQLNSRLIGPTRDARLASAENLRTIQVQEEINQSSTPEFLNLKFNRQEALTQAELAEVQAIIDYQIALSNLYFQMGIGLERSQIVFRVPEPDVD